MNKINITNSQNEYILPDHIKRYIRLCSTTTLKYENFDGYAEINVTFVDEETIKNLNANYRNKDAVTDVLSFPLGENGVYDINPENNCKLLGDVVICLKRAYEQAESYNHSIRREICFLVVHSILHLLGYDHETSNEDEEEMFQKQKEILRLCNINKDN